jgi:alcohol dehydrogenase class IV
MEQLAAVLPNSNGDAIHGLNALLEGLKVEKCLKNHGFKVDDIGRAADIAVSNPYYNPRKVDRDLIQELIRRACMGEDARADM